MTDLPPWRLHSCRTPFFKPRAKPKNRAAFTLIETVLALGIVAFGLLAVMGLLPIGLEVSRNASNTTICAQIGERLAGTIQELDFSQFPGYPSAQTQQTAFNSLSQTYYYFDGQGQPVGQGNGAIAVYSACIVPAPSSAGETTPSEVNGTAVETFQILIANDPAHVLQGQPQQISTLAATPRTQTVVAQALIIPVYYAYVPES